MHYSCNVVGFDSETFHMLLFFFVIFISSFRIYVLAKLVCIVVQFKVLCKECFRKLGVS